MSIILQHNLLMMNASRQFKTNTDQKAKSTEKLSSGYRINRAADDAAGLSMSEKMRWMIRGLNQGTENAHDGVSWVQIGDGSLDEVHSILHRMTELAVKASNATNTDADRALMEVEFDHLQKEIDRLTDATQFNEKQIFREHDYPYYQIEGSTQWPQSKSHIVRPGENDLVVTYRKKETDTPKTVSITVPTGEYTTRELMDEINSALEDAGALDEGIVFEYTKSGYCNLNLEGGEKIDEVSGGLSYLLFDNYNGGDLGALIGTTVFEPGDTLLVQNNTNDYLTFKVISSDDSEPPKDIVIDLDAGNYTKKQLIDILQNKLKAAGTNVVAEEYGTGIKLSSPDYIISEFKGNMFEIDGALYTSVFYDNIQHADITYTSAEFKGGYVLLDPTYKPTGVSYPPGYDPENAVFHFTKGVNDLLVLSPNGGEEITIDLSSMDGHDMADTCVYLNLTLAQYGLTAKAVSSTSTTNVQDINGYAGKVRYMRIEIDSQEEGLESKVGINKAKSTAYDTLFTAQNRTVYKNDAEFGGNDTINDGNAYLYGLRSLSGGLDVKAGVNDSFMIQVSSDKAVKITLDAKKYDNADAVAAEIRSKLKDAGYGDDVISVTTASGQIRMQGVTTDVTGIRVSGVSGNTGYRDIFQGEKFEPNDMYKTGNTASFTLPEKAVVRADGSVYIDPAYGNLMVQVDGDVWKQANVSGTWASLDALAKHITEQMKNPSEKNNTFTSVDQRGSSSTTSMSYPTTQGKTSSNASTTTYDKSGTTVTSGQGEGGTGSLKENSGAKVTFGKALPDTITITEQNKNFTFNVNSGSSHTIDLSKALGSNTFSSREAFKTALQAAITKELKKQPDEFGGVKVDLTSDGRLVLTAGLKTANGFDELGMNTHITLDTSKTDGFIYDLHATYDAASATLSGVAGGSTKGVNSSFTTKGNTALKLTLTQPKAGGGTTTENIELTLNGNYTKDTLLNALNTNPKLSGKVTASYDSYGRLKFTTVGKGAGYAISVDQNSPAINYLYGYEQPDGSYGLTKNTAAAATLNQTVQSNVKIEPGNEQNFTITIDGTQYTAKLDAKTYSTPQDIATEIKKQVNAAARQKNNNNVDVLSEVSIKNGQLYFKTASEKGSNSRIQVSYNADSSMKKIFGTSPVAGVTASFSPDGQLTLTRTGGPQTNAGSIYVTSDLVNSSGQSTSYRGGSFIFSDKELTDPDPYDGHHSTMHSYMDGVDLVFNAAGKVDINQWNNKLSFYYTENYGQPSNTPRQINVTLPEGGYTMDELRDALQTSIDAQTGYQRKLNVTVNRQGVRIEAVNAGMRYRIYTKNDSSSYRPSGNFYEKVICSGKSTKQTVPIGADKDGQQLGDGVFAVGRQDVKNKTVRIQKDGNDSLSLEFTIPDRADPLKLEMVLDPGYYGGGELVNQIQGKLDEALEKEGLPKGLIEVGIGIVDTQVRGNVDDRALAFKLSNQVPAPSRGRYGIDAIGGTAAFSVFYQTEGDIARAYIRGSKDITEGVEIKEGATDFSVDVSGVTYKINLTPGTYTSEQLTEHITELLKNVNCPLRAVEDEGTLKLMHTKYGKHKITNLKGAIKNQFFFIENGEKSGEESIGLRLSSVSGDQITIERPRMNTVSLGINTTLISKTKYAQIALGRIRKAVDKVSDVRSYFGAMQNRLESAIRNNENKAENTTAAESRIRDTDVAKEIMMNSVNSILEQAGVAMMTQANQSSRIALQLLS